MAPVALDTVQDNACSDPVSSLIAFSIDLRSRFFSFLLTVRVSLSVFFSACFSRGHDSTTVIELDCLLADCLTGWLSAGCLSVCPLVRIAGAQEPGSGNRVEPVARVVLCACCDIFLERPGPPVPERIGLLRSWTVLRAAETMQDGRPWGTNYVKQAEVLNRKQFEL